VRLLLDSSIAHGCSNYRNRHDQSSEEFDDLISLLQSSYMPTGGEYQNQFSEGRPTARTTTKAAKA
jgi:hypothetical protein